MQPQTGRKLAENRRSKSGPAWVLLIVTLVVAGSARLWGIDWGLPYIYHPDEPTNLTRVMVMLETGDPNPHWFHYGSLMFYVNAGALWLASSVRELVGLVGLSGAEPPTMISLASGITTASWTMIVPRALTIAAGTGATAIIYRTVFHVTQRHVAAAFSGLLFALAPVTVAEGRTFTPDTYTALFAAAALFFAIRVYERGELRDYLLAGAMVGLAVGSKYNAALLGVAVVSAHVMRQRRMKSVTPRRLLFSFYSALAAFLVTTPFAIFDAGRFLSDLGFELVHYSSGHIGFEAGPSLYVSAVVVSFSVGLLLVPFGFTSLRDRPATIVVGVYSLVYLGALSLLQVTFARNLLPVFPAIAIAIGIGVHGALSRLHEPRVIGRTAIYAACVVALAVSSVALVLEYIDLEDREPARVWIADNIEPGESVVTESYSPWIDGNEIGLRVIPYVIAVDSAESWDYLLITHNGSGRFDDDPERYPEQAAALDSIRDESCLAALFPGVAEIRTRHCS